MLEKLLEGIWLVFFSVFFIVCGVSLFIPVNNVITSGVFEIVFIAFFIAMIGTFIIDEMEKRQ